jgi:hypothetical protein
MKQTVHMVITVFSKINNLTRTVGSVMHWDNFTGLTESMCVDFLGDIIITVIVNIIETTGDMRMD